MGEFATYKDMAEEFNRHKSESDKKFRQQTEDRHDMNNVITGRFLKIEKDLENNLVKMFDKIEKILVHSVKSTEKITSIEKSQSKMERDFKHHMSEEDLDRKSLLTKEMFFWASSVLGGLLIVGVTIIGYFFMSIGDLEKGVVKVEAKLQNNSNRIELLNQLIK